MTQTTPYTIPSIPPNQSLQNPLWLRSFIHQIWIWWPPSPSSMHLQDSVPWRCDVFLPKGLAPSNKIPPKNRSKWMLLGIFWIIDIDTVFVWEGRCGRMCRLAKSSLTEVGTVKLNLPEELKRADHRKCRPLKTHPQLIFILKREPDFTLTTVSNLDFFGTLKIHSFKNLASA